MAPALGRVTTFNVPGLPWDFMDYRDVTPTMQAQALFVLETEAKEVAKKRTEGNELNLIMCSDRKIENQGEAINRFLELLKTQPRLTWDEFVRGGGVIIDEVCAQPGLASLLIVAHERGVIRGCISLSNIEIERETVDTLQVSAQPAPGFRPTRDLDRLDVWALVMRYLLVQNLSLDDGKTMDLVEWDFPKTREYRWSSDTTPEIEKLFTELVTIGDRVNTDEDVKAPLSIRRKTAPPKESTVQPVGR